MERPLNRPQASPIDIPTPIEAQIGKPACKASPVMTPDSATTDPEERSMPPVMMTKVCPQATTAISEVATRIAMMLDDDRKVEVVSDR